MSLFFPQVSEGKGKDLLKKCSFWFIKNRLVRAGPSWEAASKTTTFLETHKKWVLVVWFLHFSVSPSSESKLNLKIGKTFLKIKFFGTPCPQKWSYGLTSLVSCRLWQCQHACKVLAYFHVLFQSQEVKYSLKWSKIEKTENIVVTAAFLCHHEIYLYAKKIGLPDSLFCQLLANKHMRVGHKNTFFLMTYVADQQLYFVSNIASIKSNRNYYLWG